MTLWPELERTLVDAASRSAPRSATTQTATDNDRLAQTDCRPASRSPVRRWWIAGAAGAAAACCAVLAVLLFSSSTGPLGVSMAYAGWTATPTKPTAAAVARALAACDWLADHRSAAKLLGRRVLTDQRGRFVAVIYVSGTEETDCISDGRHTATGVGSDGHMLKAFAAPGLDQLGLGGGGSSPAAGFPGSDSRGVYSYTRGLAGSNISAVTFRLADRLTVHATVQNGWYFAWWPNGDNPTSVRVRTKSGSTITSDFNCHPGMSGCIFAGSKPLRHLHAPGSSAA